MKPASHTSPRKQPIGVIKVYCTRGGLAVERPSDVREVGPLNLPSPGCCRDREQEWVGQATAQKSKILATVFMPSEHRHEITLAMQVLDYTYSEQSRRPGTLFALTLSAAILAAGGVHAAPWFFLSPVLLAFLMLIWMVVVNRKSGVSLTGDHLKLFAGRWHQVVPTEHIRSVKVVHWSEGAPTITLSLAASPALIIPGYCFGSADDLMRALASRGIMIVESGRSSRRLSA